jgi:hypothetical protein
MSEWWQSDCGGRIDLFKRNNDILYLVYNTDTDYKLMCVKIMVKVGKTDEDKVVYSFPTPKDIEEINEYFQWERITGACYISTKLEIVDILEADVEKFCEEYLLKMIYEAIIPYNDKFKNMMKTKKGEFTDNILFWHSIGEIIVTEIKKPAKQIIRAWADELFNEGNKKLESEKGQIFDSEPIQPKDCKGEYDVNPLYACGIIPGFEGCNLNVEGKSLYVKYGKLDREGTSRPDKVS